MPNYTQRELEPPPSTGPDQNAICYGPPCEAFKVARGPGKGLRMRALVPVRMGNTPIAAEAVGGETARLGMGAGLFCAGIYKPGSHDMVRCEAAAGNRMREYNLPRRKCALWERLGVGPCRSIAEASWQNPGRARIAPVVG